jgi:hypothetical protein
VPLKPYPEILHCEVGDNIFGERLDVIACCCSRSSLTHPACCFLTGLYGIGVFYNNMGGIDKDAAVVAIPG